MQSPSLVRFLRPWKHRRDQQAQQLLALRSRDGDDCRRCRRPIRFDLPAGHELGFRFEKIVAGVESFDNLCLTHGRCNAKGQDHTGEVLERLRPTREAELFSKARKKREAA